MDRGAQVKLPVNSELIEAIVSIVPFAMKLIPNLVS
uniref:Uncharacterized protein n=1 Tax=Lepeophtheirus salmonis TaxID=72036 RepID=A0A0K2TQA7_LEPSM